ncbi:hypothetical protein LINGRAPRIM_LOCUS2350 [Linum grandiflorum]
MPGRPRKVRRKEAHELEMIPAKNGGTVLRRRCILMHCSKCSGSGHNARHYTEINEAKDVHLSSPVRRRAREGSLEIDSHRQRRVICGSVQELALMLVPVAVEKVPRVLLEGEE